MPNKKPLPMADMDCADYFDALMRSPAVPSAPNSEWIAEAKAATRHHWDKMASELTTVLLEEGRQLGLIMPDPEVNSEIDQLKND